MSAEEFKALPPEQQEAAIIATHAQMILDLVRAARLPLSIRTLAAMQVAMETFAEEVEAQLSPEDIAAVAAKTKEIYLARNMSDALKGGSHKAIITG